MNLLATLSFFWVIGIMLGTVAFWDLSHLTIKSNKLRRESSAFELQVIEEWAMGALLSVLIMGFVLWPLYLLAWINAALNPSIWRD